MFKLRRASRSPGAIHKAYTLTETLLGRGGYAEVRLGYSNDSGEPVAVKIFDKTKMSKTGLKSLKKEVRILKSLEHRKVVKVYDSFDEPTAFYIVMEYIAGGELFAKIADEEYHFNEDKSRDIIRTIAEALKYCKDQGVIHRDIKPENILLTTDEEGGEIKICDFNLAEQVDLKAVNSNVLVTMCGTPHYVAPEVISGEPYGYKCDIWSLGVIAYLLLSGGYLPFFVESGIPDRGALLRKVQKGKWKFTPEPVWTKVSPLAKDLLMKMLTKDPEVRVSYEQLLAHPWFKSTDSTMNEAIDMTRMIRFNRKRRLLAAGKMQRAVGILKNLMDDNDEFEDQPEHIDNLLDGVLCF